MSDETLDHVYPGVARLNYFLSNVAIIAVMVGALFVVGPESPVFRLLSLGAMIAGVVLDVMRLRNIGVSQWFALLKFVPLVSTLLSVGLQSAPTGWIETRRLDRAGWTIVGVYIALFVFLMVVSFFPPRIELVPLLID